MEKIGIEKKRNEIKEHHTEAGRGLPSATSRLLSGLG